MIFSKVFLVRKMLDGMKKIQIKNIPVWSTCNNIKASLPARLLLSPQSYWNKIGPVRVRCMCCFVGNTPLDDIKDSDRTKVVDSFIWMVIHYNVSVETYRYILLCWNQLMSLNSILLEFGDATYLFTKGVSKQDILEMGIWK